MKYKCAILIISLIFISCVLIGAVSAVDVEAALNDGKDNNLYCCKQVSNLKENKVVKTYGSDHSAYVEFNEKEIKKAKSDYMGVTKKAEGKVKVKKYYPKYKKVKKVKKFTCMSKTKKKVILDKKSFKKYYKCKQKGYKVKLKWKGNKCICTAKKTVKKIVGYKSKWVKSKLNANLFYTEGGMIDEGWYIDFFPRKCHDSPDYYIRYKANFWIDKTV